MRIARRVNQGAWTSAASSLASAPHDLPARPPGVHQPRARARKPPHDEQFLDHQIPADDFIDLTIATVAGNHVGPLTIGSSFKQASRKKAKLEERGQGSPFTTPLPACEQILTSSASHFTVSSVEIDAFSSVSPINEPIVVHAEKRENDSQMKNFI